MLHKFTLLILSTIFPAAYAQSVNQLCTLSEDATWQYFNAEARLAWSEPGGNWLDRQGVINGNEPFRTLTIKQSRKPQSIAIDLGEFKDDIINPSGNIIIHLKASGRGLLFTSLESELLSHRPYLLVKDFNGDQNHAFATVDTYLDNSTVKSLGHKLHLKASNRQNVFISFSLDIPPSAIQSMTLNLTTTKQYENTMVSVYSGNTCSNRVPSQNLAGAISQYDYKLALSFERAHDIEMIDFSSGSHYEVIYRDDNKRAKANAALAITVKKGSNLGLNASLWFKRLWDREPEAVYFQYRIMFDKSWDSIKSGGKLPGLAGTYNRGGWGGRTSDGYNGWSMRGLFEKTIQSPNVLKGGTPVGSYAYYAEMKDRYGEHWHWNNGYGHVLFPEKWYTLEQFVKLNDPGKSNGIFRAWIDGVPAFENANINYRKTKDLKIERVWLNIYHGGLAKSHKDQRVYLDDIKVSSTYIGTTQGTKNRDFQ